MLISFIPTCLILSASLPFLVTTAQDVGDFTHKGSFYTMTYKVNEDKQVTYDIDVPQVRVTSNVIKLGPYPMRSAPVPRYRRRFLIDFDRSNITAVEWCKRLETFFKNTGIIGLDEAFSPAVGDQPCDLAALLFPRGDKLIASRFQDRRVVFRRKGFPVVPGKFVYDQPEESNYKVTCTVRSEDDVLIEVEADGAVVSSRFKLSLRSRPWVDREYITVRFGDEEYHLFWNKLILQWYEEWSNKDLQVLFFATEKTIYTRFLKRRICLTKA
ncbi:hypothetical protein FOZ63_025441 [Perkinsus olseni]|uniref:Uncharacterized protein n=1 Tax=Perkinsus olseni TaxID=32597 RepID=A0A7J6SXM8_PEROL|nr:hypothetical protein FOZ63_025441 [Perkinsus olseni]KAF4737390.1 hypothetical protein FOZ62_013804 [Perkinsus olseni]